MKPSVMVVDYGMGNLLSVTRALEHCGAQVAVESSPDEVARAERLILPGVGAFGGGMSELQERNLIGALRDYAAAGRPFLGICLGLQMLFDGSDEFGASAGLGLIPGWVRQLPAQQGIKLPHVGWSAILPGKRGSWDGSLIEHLGHGAEAYFVHSYFVDPADQHDCLAQTSYGKFEFCSVVKKRNIAGCQFHPEKSGETGLGIIRQFLRT